MKQFLTPFLTLNQAVLLLRVGVGLTLFAGGLSKLSSLLSPAAQAGLVTKYLSPNGYINQFFYDYLFADGIMSGLMSPWFFLTSLSALEFLAGVLLIIGLAVRPVSLLFALLFWSFVIALPVVNAPGAPIVETTHTAPAILVMIRDIALSGVFFALHLLGAGSWSVDRRLFGEVATEHRINWDAAGLLLRISLGAVFVVGGAFYGLQNIKAFAPAWILLPIGIVLIIGNGARIAAYVSAVVLLWYMVVTMGFDKSLIANLNSVKREFALFATAIVIGQFGGGSAYTLLGKFQEARDVWQKAPILGKASSTADAASD